MLRSIFFLIWLYGCMVFVGLACLPTLLLPKKYAIVAIKTWMRMARWGLRVIGGITTEFRGQEHIQATPVIVASKHQSMWETLCLHLLFDDLRIIMKRELRYYPVFGWYALKFEQIPIDRGGSVKTLKNMAKAAAQVVEDGASVLIFPEGTRVAPSAPPAYHRAGLGFLYKELNLPITPVALNTGLFWPARGVRRYPGKAVVQVLPPVGANLPRDEMMAQVESAIETATQALVAEGKKSLEK